MQARGTCDLKRHAPSECNFFWELEDSPYNTQDKPASRPVMSDPDPAGCTTAGGITCQMLAHHPSSACDQVFSPRATHATHPHQLFPGGTTRQNLSDCGPRLLLFAVDDTRQADPGHHSSLQRGMAASQAGGFQGLAVPLPEGQKLERLFLCALCMRRD